jgi:tetrahydromethanopterin S-methyltransferase subunit G
MPNELLTLPAQCQLDKDRLERIEDKLDETLEELKQVVAYDGPLGNMRSDISNHGTRIGATEHRLDGHDTHIEKIKGSHAALVMKIAGLGIGGGGIGYVLVEIIKRMG